MIKDGLWDAYNNYHMGTTAENINDIWGITRQRAGRVRRRFSAEGLRLPGTPARFDDEIVPVPVKVKKEIVEFKRDEYPKDGVTADSIAKLQRRFPRGPRVPQSSGGDTPLSSPALRTPRTRARRA